MKSILAFIKTHFIFVSILILLLVIPLIILFFKPSKEIILPSGFPTPTPYVSQQSFHVIDVSPKDGATDVYTGEQAITFKTDIPLTSEKSFQLTISPQGKDYYIKMANNVFPTQTINAYLLGELMTNTQYKLSVLNQNQEVVYSWTFTTSNTQPQSSSGIITDQENNYIQKYYPLFNYVPYSSSDFDLDYQTKLTLIVKIKNPEIDKVKQEVNDWIRSKGVDPSTHTINYVNSF